MAAAPLRAAIAATAWLWPAAASADPTARWAAEIAHASSRFGIPEEWVRRVIRVESGGNALLGGRPIVSRAGAMGLMQLMPGTWRDMRLALGLGADPYDPSDNIAAGTFYLRLMYQRFGYPGLFAAYNAGPARYAAFLTSGRALPAETGAYIAAVAPARRRRSAMDEPSTTGIFARPTSVEAASPEPRSAHSRSPSLFVALSNPGQK